jgi:hypothetical protein
MTMCTHLSILHTKIGETESSSLTQLATELRELRPDRSADANAQWIHYLMEFYRQPLTGKYEPINRNCLGHEILLQSRVDDMKDERVRALVAELAHLNHEHFEHHGHEKLYVALNRLMRGRFRRRR